MNPLRLSLLALASTAFASPSLAELPEPGSVLLYPIHRSGGNLFTVVSVTNTHTTPAGFGQLGGTTNVLYEYVNTVPNPANSKLPLDCYIVDRVEQLTPADTLSVLTSCHNAASAEGYLVISACDPLDGIGKTAWSHNYLVGSELVATALGGLYSINAICAETDLEDGVHTDPEGDDDGEKDFDGVEYDEFPDELILDNFIAVAGSSLTLMNLSGGFNYNAVVQFDIWNDNEKPLSATVTFRCWMEEALESVSPVFSESYLANNVPNDPTEVDLNCDGVGDLESGWALIDGIVANSPDNSIQDPALLGAITAGPIGSIDGGRLLWGRGEQDNGDFPEFDID